MVQTNSYPAFILEAYIYGEEFSGGLVQIAYMRTAQLKRPMINTNGTHITTPLNVTDPMHFTPIQMGFEFDSWIKI